MPVMTPSTSARNFTPTSMAFGSDSEATAGTVEGFQMLHGQSLGVTVTVLPADGASKLAVSSTARLLRVMDPCVPGVQEKLHDDVPLARRHDVPPSTETSTAATMPPPVSV